MSNKRHHLGWLSLAEVSGPFLTMPVLVVPFPTRSATCSPLA